MSKNQIVYSASEKGIVNVLKTTGKPMTLSQINSVGGTDYKTGSLTSLINKGKIAKGEQVPVTMSFTCECGKVHTIELKGKKVNTYIFVADI